MKAGKPQKGTVPRLRRATLGLWFVVSVAPFRALDSKGSLLSLRVCARERTHVHTRMPAPKHMCTQVCVLPSVLKDISGTLRACEKWTRRGVGRW